VVIRGTKKNSIYQPDVMRGMEALKLYMLKDPNVGYAISIADIIKNINKCEIHTIYLQRKRP
jgi:predicted RND superfamily exporter protein